WTFATNVAKLQSHFSSNNGEEETKRPPGGSWKVRSMMKCHIRKCAAARLWHRLGTPRNHPHRIIPRTMTFPPDHGKGIIIPAVLGNGQWQPFNGGAMPKIHGRTMTSVPV